MPDINRVAENPAPELAFIWDESFCAVDTRFCGQVGTDFPIDPFLDQLPVFDQSAGCFMGEADLEGQPTFDFNLITYDEHAIIIVDREPEAVCLGRQVVGHKTVAAPEGFQNQLAILGKDA
jgi:hypothetical protein